MISLLALGDGDRCGRRRGLRLGRRTGPPVFDPRPAYWLGTLYLALAGSVITFPLYFRLIQRIGAGPCRLYQRADPDHRHGASRRSFEGYRWTRAAPCLAWCLRWAAWSIALRARLPQGRRLAPRDSPDKAAPSRAARLALPFATRRFSA